LFLFDRCDEALIFFHSVVALVASVEGCQLERLGATPSQVQRSVAILRDVLEMEERKDSGEKKKPRDTTGYSGAVRRIRCA
jgi:hypothetical protein